MSYLGIGQRFSAFLMEVSVSPALRLRLWSKGWPWLSRLLRGLSPLPLPGGNFPRGS